MTYARLVTIDAWRSPDGWTWNDSRTLREYTAAEIKHVIEGDNPRRIFRFLRDAGYLTRESAGRVRLDVSGSDPDYLTIEARHTGEPLIALIVDYCAEGEPSDPDVRASQTELGAAYAKHLDDQIADKAQRAIEHGREETRKAQHE